MEDVHILNNIGPTNPVQILNAHNFLKLNLDVGTGVQQQRQEVY